MQEGSLRVDGNINLHIETPDGKIATPIVEIKNMNSFRAVERALTYEAERQYEVWEETGQKIGDVPKQTRGWDDAANVTRGQRHKEESSDYRYFPDPDLTPVTVAAAEVEKVRAALGELPADLRKRLENEFGISAYDSDVLVNQGRALVDYYLHVANATGDGKLASNWLQQDVLRTLNDRGLDIAAFPVTAEALVVLLKKVQAGELITSRAREVLQEMIDTGKSAEEVMLAKGIAKVDESELVTLCQELLAANPKAVEDFKAGKQQSIGALVGQAKKKNPNVNPSRVREILLEEVAKL
jgi:aspartyl-tRNA(Asn)/glutamyl-tRNA(Gln) amidotransferase subunit B